MPDRIGYYRLTRALKQRLSGSVIAYTQINKCKYFFDNTYFILTRCYFGRLCHTALAKQGKNKASFRVERGFIISIPLHGAELYYREGGTLCAL